MFRFFRRRRGYNLLEREMLAAQRTRGVRQLVCVAAVIVLVVASFVGTMIVLSPLYELYELRGERQFMEEKLHEAKMNEEMHRDHYRWMQDPEYFEQIARDRANMAKPGEKVIRISEPSHRPPRDEAPLD